MNGKRDRQLPPPPRLLLDGELQVRAVNTCLRRICNLGADVWRGIPVDEWINAETALLTRVRAAMSHRSPLWFEIVTLRLPGDGAIVARLKLLPLCGRRSRGLLVTVEEIQTTNGPKAVLAA